MFSLIRNLVVLAVIVIAIGIWRGGSALLLARPTLKAKSSSTGRSARTR